MQVSESNNLLYFGFFKPLGLFLSGFFIKKLNFLINLYIYNKRFIMKKVKITESELVEMINAIVTEAVAEKKAQWIAENEAKQASLIESKVNDLMKEKLASLLK